MRHAARNCITLAGGRNFLWEKLLTRSQYEQPCDAILHRFCNCLGRASGACSAIMESNAPDQQKPAEDPPGPLKAVSEATKYTVLVAFGLYATGFLIWRSYLSK